MTDTSKSNKKIYNKTTPTQELILDSLYNHGPLGINEIADYSKLNRETVRFNCRQLVKQCWIYDRGESQKGKYRLVEQSKIPAFLTFRAHNRTLKTKILHDIFSDNTNNSSKSLDDFSKNIGIYISYVLLKATRPGGPWTAKGFKTNDPRMKNIDLLCETWLEDMIDHDSFFKQFLLLKSNNNDSNNNNYQELVKKFESTFPDIYNKIRFHEEIAEVRKLKKQNTKKKQQESIEKSTRTEEEYWEEISDEFVEQSQKWKESVSKTKEYYESLDKRNKNKIIKSD